MAQTITYRARPGLNTYPSARSRYFAPLPKMLQVKCPWYCDAKYYAPFANVGGVLQGAACPYWFIDPLDMGRATSTYGTGVGGKYFFSPDLGAFLSLYQEARFRTHVLNLNFSAEVETVYGSNSANETMAKVHTTVLHIAVAAVPLSYLRKADGNPHVIGDAGGVFQGVDYYASLSQQPGCKQVVLPLDGSLNSLKSVRVEIDGFDHNTTSQIIRSSQTWTTVADQPTLTVTYPDPATRNVFLIACRIAGLPYGNTTNSLYVRTEMKLEQHLTFTDKFPSFPYIVDTVT